MPPILFIGNFLLFKAMFHLMRVKIPSVVKKCHEGCWERFSFAAICEAKYLTWYTEKDFVGAQHTCTAHKQSKTLERFLKPG